MKINKFGICFILVLVFSLLIGLFFYQRVRSERQSALNDPDGCRLSWGAYEHDGQVPLYTLVPIEEYADLEKRVPVILIHGVTSELKPFCNWRFLIDELSKSGRAEQKAKYAFFIFRYETSGNNWQHSVNSLDKAVKNLVKQLEPATKINFIVSSLGGCIFCEVIDKQPLYKERIDKVISLGTPFWGTPLLVEALSSNASSDLGSINKAIFKSTNKIFSGLVTNVDWKLPVDYKQESLFEPPCNGLDQNIISYAAFIESPFIAAEAPKKQITEKWLREILQSSNYKHAWNSLMHYKIAKEMFWDQKHQDYLWNYNDGLVPLYSALRLEPKVVNFTGKLVLSSEELSQIRKSKPKARIFAGIDHSDFTDIQASSSKGAVKDILNGKEASIANFIFEDLD
jgi:hypothetical protein